MFWARAASPNFAKSIAQFCCGRRPFFQEKKQRLREIFSVGCRAWSARVFFHYLQKPRTPNDIPECVMLRTYVQVWSVISVYHVHVIMRVRVDVCVCVCMFVFVCFMFVWCLLWCVCFLWVCLRA